MMGDSNPFKRAVTGATEVTEEVIIKVNKTKNTTKTKLWRNTYKALALECGHVIPITNLLGVKLTATHVRCYPCWSASDERKAIWEGK
jgi:hypothetical protein